MTRKGQAQAIRPIPDWAALRPPVTEALLEDITQRIVAQFQPYQVVLFGSYAYGTPDLESDVDLLVVMDADEPMVQRIRRVTEVAKVRFLPMDIICAHSCRDGATAGNGRLLPGRDSGQGQGAISP